VTVRIHIATEVIDRGPADHFSNARRIAQLAEYEATGAIAGHRID
jgi:hypothetical protein